MKTEVTQKITAHADDVWATIAKGGDVHRWFEDVIVACDLRGHGEGAERLCTMANGADLRERILEINHDMRRFRYAIEKHPLPATDVVTTITVVGLGQGGAEVTWSAEYSVDPAHETTVDDALKAIYAQGIQSLETYHTVASQGDQR
ncbi:MAG: SRPBCC family protein [Pseudomonadota bacterium]